MPREPALSECESKVVAAYQAGATLGSLAAQYGVSRRPIERILREAGVPIRRRGKQTPEVDPRQVVELYRDLGSKAQVARQLDVNVKVVDRILRANDVRIDPTPGTRKGTRWAPKGERRV